MNKHRIRTLAGVSLAALITAVPLLVGGGASAVATAGPASASPTTVTVQKGLVLESVGDHAQVFVYENSTYGNSIQVVLDGRDGEMIGYAEQAGPFVVDGTLDAVVEVEGIDVTIEGTVATAGKPTKIVEPLQDAGQQIVTRGTNTPLATDLVLRYEHSEFPLTSPTAFAFELTSRSTTLYGG